MFSRIRLFAVVAAAALLLVATVLVAEPGDVDRSALAYPATRTVDHVDVLHGTPVADPYRWLEEADSDEVVRWTAQQNALTRSVLDNIPTRGRIHKRLRQLWNQPRRDPPMVRGERIFYLHNDGLEPQDVLYVQDGVEAEPRVLLDPNEMWPEGRHALASVSPSRDGKWVAYAVSYGGSDWREWHVRNVDTGEDLETVVRYSKFSNASWAADSSGFYYTRYPAPAEPSDDDNDANDGGSANEFAQVCFHRIGTDPADDELVYERPDEPRALLWGSETQDGRFRIVSASLHGGNRREILVRDMTDPRQTEMKRLLHMHGARGAIIGNDGATFYMHTNEHTPRFRLVAFDYREPGLWHEVIPQPRNKVLRNVRLFGATLYAFYEMSGRQQIVRYDLDGERLGELEMPELGTASGFNSFRDAEVAYYQLATFAAPPAIHRLDLATGESEEVYRPEGAFAAGEIETHHLEYVSRDGTSVPMVLMHPAGIELDGTNPTLLRGYGGFGQSTRPRYSRAEQVWFEMGGVVALPSLRGGGDLGQHWHEAGRRENKQNTFDDFIYAAKWLIRENYTSPQRLAIRGASNGGLLVGAVLNQRPSLFGAALPHAGVMDMLRFHRFTIGYAWTSEYGSPDDPEMFHHLLGYSPYHNIRTGIGYPPTLIAASQHDDRVVPAHSYKYAARLQANQVGNAPILLRVETHSGHGVGLTMDALIDNTADWLAFVADVFEIDLPK